MTSVQQLNNHNNHSTQNNTGYALYTFQAPAPAPASAPLSTIPKTFGKLQQVKVNNVPKK